MPLLPARKVFCNTWWEKQRWETDWRQVDNQPITPPRAVRCLGKDVNEAQHDVRGCNNISFPSETVKTQSCYRKHWFSSGASIWLLRLCCPLLVNAGYLSNEHNVRHTKHSAARAQYIVVGHRHEEISGRKMKRCTIAFECFFIWTLFCRTALSKPRQLRPEWNILRCFPRLELGIYEKNI